MSKTKQVVEYLKQHGSITTEEARIHLNTRSLPYLVGQINKQGKYKVCEKMKGYPKFDWHKKDNLDSEYRLED